MRQSYCMLITFTYAGNEKWYWSEENKDNTTAIWTVMEQYAKKFPSSIGLPITKAKASVTTIVHIETVTRVVTYA